MKIKVFISEHCVECKKPMTDKDVFSTHHCNECVRKMLVDICENMSNKETGDTKAIRKHLKITRAKAKMNKAKHKRRGCR